MRKNETSLSAVYLTIPVIRVHGSVYCKIFFHSPANECSRHIEMSVVDRLKYLVTFLKQEILFISNTGKCFSIRKLTLCTLSINQKVTYLFILLICLFYVLT